MILFILSFGIFTANAQSFYNLEAKTIDGKTFKFEQLKEKKLIFCIFSDFSVEIFNNIHTNRHELSKAIS